MLRTGCCSEWDDAAPLSEEGWPLTRSQGCLEIVEVKNRSPFRRCPTTGRYQVSDTGPATSVSSFCKILLLPLLFAKPVPPPVAIYGADFIADLNGGGHNRQTHTPVSTPHCRFQISSERMLQAAGPVGKVCACCRCQQCGYLSCRWRCWLLTCLLPSWSPVQPPR